MTRTVFYSATTLDGYLADEHDSLDWLFSQDQDPAGPLNYEEFIAGVGSLVMGATTYAWVLDHLAAEGGGWPYEMPCWVLTHRDFAPAPGIHLAAADDDAALRAVHDRLVEAAGERDVWVVGGGGLAARLAEVGRLDELILYLAPVTLGAGRPLLPRPIDLRLVELDRNRDFICARYEVVGPRGAPAPTLEG